MDRTTTKLNVLSASTMIGDDVRNPQGESLGKLEEIMLDVDRGCVSYAVLSFGGIMGIGDKLFAIPWQALTLDTENHAFVLDVDRERLKNMPGFDKNNWPETTDHNWLTTVYDAWGYDLTY